MKELPKYWCRQNLSFDLKIKNIILIFVFVIAGRGNAVAGDREIFFTSAGKQVEVLKGTILVKFKDNVTGNVKRSILGKTGARKIGGIEKIGVDRVKVPDGKTVNETVAMFSGRDDVVYAEPVYIRRALKLPDEYASKTELKQRQWGLEKIDATEGWDVETGKDVVIAVLDTGIDLDHSDLAGNIWNNPDSDTEYDSDKYTIKYDTHGWDFINDDNDPNDDISISHGTHCSGIIAAVANNSVGSGMVGVSWNNKLMAVKILDSIGEGDSLGLVYGIIYAADRGADVISMSLGADTASQAEIDAVNYAYNRGCVIVAASGNGGPDYIGDPTVYYPAAYENVIAVGATNDNDERADFSNYGQELDVVAPGEAIYSTVIGGYGSMGGTSMACPHVAGLASLVISYWNRGGNTSWTPSQVKNAITSNCDDINSIANSGWDRYTGYGRINVRSTLEFISSGGVNVDDNKVVVYPNPFNPDYQRARVVLPKNSSGVVRKMRVYSMDGQEVREVSGSGSVVYWDGTNDDGEVCAPGLYFYYLDMISDSKKGKITLIR